MALPYDEELVASCTSQIQPTGNNLSLLPIHTTLPPEFPKGYAVSFRFVFLVEDEYANRYHITLVCASCLTRERDN